MSADAGREGLSALWGHTLAESLAQVRATNHFVKPPPENCEFGGQRIAIVLKLRAGLFTGRTRQPLRIRPSGPTLADLMAEFDQLHSSVNPPRHPEHSSEDDHPASACTLKSALSLVTQGEAALLVGSFASARSFGIAGLAEVTLHWYRWTPMNPGFTKVHIQLLNILAASYLEVPLPSQNVWDEAPYSHGNHLQYPRRSVLACSTALETLSSKAGVITAATYRFNATWHPDFSKVDKITLFEDLAGLGALVCEVNHADVEGIRRCLTACTVLKDDFLKVEGILKERFGNGAKDSTHVHDKKYYDAEVVIVREMPPEGEEPLCPSLECLHFRQTLFFLPEEEPNEPDPAAKGSPYEWSLELDAWTLRKYEKHEHNDERIMSNSDINEDEHKAPSFPKK